MNREFAAPDLVPPSELPFFKKHLAWIIGEVLSALSARHDKSWSRAFARGDSAGYKRGDSAGYKRGERRGSLQAYAEGYAAGRLELEIKDSRNVAGARPGIDNFLFNDWKLPITAEVEQRMRVDVTALLPKHKQPTTEQWKMILSRTPSTYVIAGAGSGKSTTLILRILLLHHYLDFELGSMTVVTFTKLSRLDFIGKLRQTFQLWKRAISQETAEALVSTFHAKILGFTRSLYDEKINSFEFFGSKQKEDDATATLDNPFQTRLNEKQRELLNSCYSELYSKSLRFTELIGALYYHSLSFDVKNLDSELVKKRTTAIKSVAERDVESMDLIEKAWADAGAWPIPGVTAARETILVKNVALQIHGRIAASPEIAVVLRPNNYPGEKTYRPNSTFLLVSEMAVKKTICDAYSGKKIIWVDTAADLVTLVKWLSDRAAFSPTFDYQVSGDLSSSPLLDCFVAAAAFIENLGLNVTVAIAKMKFAKNDSERLFFEALGIFWPKFIEYLGKQKPRLMTFNQMFSLFGEGNSENLSLVPDGILRSMSQLMIDEFQDISPQIVSWIMGSLQEVRRRGQDLSAGRRARHSSLLCVGDDWQSIYGWRGSSPQYFINFEEEFPSPSVTPIMLRENFRSHQLIIDAAEKIVAMASSIPGKKAKSDGPAARDPVPVQVHESDDAKLRKLVSTHYAAGDEILILYREGGDTERSRIEDVVRATHTVDRRLPDEKQRLRIMTIHKSKGLEADAVFLLGDCKFKISSPYKNQIYRIAKIGDPDDSDAYDTSQKEEMLRLAYVGITRAAKHCYWFLETGKAPSTKPKASDFIPSNVPFFQDLRHL
ncbi:MULTISPECIES: UvrD-helicase domain-containing protein [Janthinobacterium]|uniref:UvrD-helicase domain-containing protein n=1 Tax=Janthinobacterium TaxID=29580 RepID=UPI000C1004C0|nr:MULTISPECIES: UvrD-helicase domain-containing protein [Janthinobacterium]PHV22782.1 DNA helicase UvrD [Janthinobacterium sp. BJB446]QKY09184.1 UvrD-helicase domain-containing protein [Janthinobacterium lividum]